MSKKPSLEKQMERLESAVKLLEDTQPEGVVSVPERVPAVMPRSESKADPFEHAWEMAKATTLGFSDKHKGIFTMGWQAAMRQVEPPKGTGQ